MHQVVDAAPSTLRRDRQASVLDEAAVVAEIGEILARGSASRCVARLDGVRATLVLNQAPAPERFSQIGTDRVTLLLGHPMSLGATVSCRRCHPRSATPVSSLASSWPNLNGPLASRVAPRSGEM